MSSSPISHPASGVSRLSSNGRFSSQVKIYVAGHRGLVGSAIVRKLLASGYSPQSLVLRTSSELDLCDSAAVAGFFEQERPEYVFLAAARVGGIVANSSYPADFIRNNLQIQTNVIDSAYRNGVKKLLFLGSSCIYPKMAPQPITEECLLTGSLEPTNEWYAIAKIAGIKMCQAYRKQYGFDAICAMPTNLYGPNDNFDLETSHVLPAMIRKFHLAKLAVAGDVESIAADEARNGRIPDDVLTSLGLARSSSHISRAIVHISHLTSPISHSPKVILWGSGSPRREFLHVDDLADACLFLMTPDVGRKTEDGITSHISHPTFRASHLFNIGVGEDVSIRELAELVRGIVGFEGDVIWDESRPDGTPRKLLDVSKLAGLGWQAKARLSEGVADVYHQYCHGTMAQSL